MGWVKKTMSNVKEWERSSEGVEAPEEEKGGYGCAQKENLRQI